MELNKNEKKIARTLISKALEMECGTFLKDAERLLQQEKAESEHERYLKLYSLINDFDNYIASRYDRLSGSHYFGVIAGLFCDGILQEEDIEHEMQEWLIRIRTHFHNSL